MQYARIHNRYGGRRSLNTAGAGSETVAGASTRYDATGVSYSETVVRHGGVVDKHNSAVDSLTIAEANRTKAASARILTVEKCTKSADRTIKAADKPTNAVSSLTKALRRGASTARMTSRTPRRASLSIASSKNRAVALVASVTLAFGGLAFGLVNAVPSGASTVDEATKRVATLQARLNTLCTNGIAAGPSASTYQSYKSQYEATYAQIKVAMANAGLGEVRGYCQAFPQDSSTKSVPEGATSSYQQTTQAQAEKDFLGVAKQLVATCDKSRKPGITEAEWAATKTEYERLYSVAASIDTNGKYPMVHGWCGTLVRWDGSANKPVDTEPAASARADAAKAKREAPVSAAAPAPKASNVAPSSGTASRPVSPTPVSPTAAIQRPATQPTPLATAPTSAVSNDVWAKLATCESGIRNVVDPSGSYYGYFQFSPATWRSVGGTGLPTQHSYDVQKQFAQKLQARSGWGQWPACSASLGLR